MSNFTPAEVQGQTAVAPLIKELRTIFRQIRAKSLVKWRQIRLSGEFNQVRSHQPSELTPDRSVKTLLEE
jgi:hypothetical protein